MGYLYHLKRPAAATGKRPVSVLPPEPEAPETWTDLTERLANPAQPDPAGQPGLERARADQFSLVLTALAIPHQINFRPGSGLRLLAPAAWAEQAMDELTAWQAEDNQAAEQARARTRSDGAQNEPVTAMVLLLLILFHLLASGDLPGLGQGLDWKTLGYADASLIRQGQWFRLVTAMTLHQDVIHLLGNVILGWPFFWLVCRRLGAGLGWLMIIVSGALGNLFTAWIHDWNHISLGASSMVFAAVGLIGGYTVLAGHFQGKRDLIKGVGAALAILAMMGASGERVDLMAHFFSLACGLILGLAMGLISKAGQKIPSLISTLAGLAAILLVGLSWLEAIAKGSVD